jgi:hypothetical protein
VQDRKKALFSKRQKELVMPAIEEENIRSCPASFGYLAYLSKAIPIPQQCYYCHKLVECRSNTKK